MCVCVCVCVCGRFNIVCVCVYVCDIFKMGQVPDRGGRAEELRASDIFMEVEVDICSVSVCLCLSGIVCF